MDPYINNFGFNTLIIVFIFYVLYMTYKQISNIEIGLLFQDEFQDEFQSSGGGSFYSRLLLMLIGIYLLSYRKRNVWRILGILCFIPNIIINTKGILFLPILAIFFILILYNRIKNPRKAICIVVVLGVSIFLGSYIFQSMLEDSELSYSERFKSTIIKLYSYLISGVQAFSYNVRYASDDRIFQFLHNTTIVPFNSLLAKFGFAETYSNVTPVIVPTGSIPNYGVTTSNVNTLIGTLFLYNGFGGGLVLLIFWVGVACYIRTLAFSTRHPFTMVLLGLFYAGFLLGWFEFYFMHTFWMYFVAFVMILNLLLNKKIVVWKSTALQ